MKKLHLMFGMLILALALAIIPSTGVLAAAPFPALGTADVNGDSSEWDLTNDFFADMHEAGKNDKEVLSKLYLRYDCTNEVLYVLVSLESPHQLNPSNDDQFVKINASKAVDGSFGDDGVPPDFAYLGSGDANAPGWEASLPLAKNMTYALQVHAQVDTPGGQSGRTSSTTPDKKANNREIDLTTDCPTAITLADFSVDANDGRAMILWETATEIDNAGFNLYRAPSPDGPWVQINSELILAEGDPVIGANYTFVDTPGRGVYYYRLEDVDFYGVTTLHDPFKAQLGPVIRVPWFRPTMPSF